ncbi:sigma-54-dependent transcriptional regulator [Burkholderia ubonensis]|uniref:sigma-54 dependent transcriptional regulator n=1 Tax=Burkholderia ubonensis TaxID=101571 RepID=UPI0009B38981|nr:sigma-54 dependent transcriptional regulator [Burkholderia ubonensis]
MRRTSSSACASRIRSEARHRSEVTVRNPNSATPDSFAGAGSDSWSKHSNEPTHSIDQRSLVYFSRRIDDQLVNGLRDRNWNVSCAKSVSELRRHLNANRVQVGIITFGGLGADDLISIGEIVRSRQFAWVALADNRCLEVPDVRKLIRQYCFAYVTEPLAHATIEYLVGHAYGMMALADGESAFRDHEMIGACDAMQQLFRTVRRVATTNAAVFISGESGTGKELTALAIHERSSRRKAPFVAINCGAIPHHLLQSELFGYERGAFTGANQRKIGRIESAHGGTLFLDEIGDMPLESQASMLRFLQERRIERLGGRESIPVDVRILSATHVDLEKAIADGRFREDLFYRLCVLRIDEPPLRARGKDIELLARHMLQTFRGDGATKIRGFTPCAIEAMYRYEWPGNVRELINRIRRAIVLAESSLISAHDLGLGWFDEQRPMTLAEVRQRAERHAIEAALLRHRNRPSKAAKDLGISRVTLYRLMHASGLQGSGKRVASGAQRQP